MKWSVAYATGIEELDRQHQMLFTMSEDFRTSLDEDRGDRTYGLMLDALADYASGHFAVEETCMARYQCPVADLNREAHASFLDALKGFQQQYQIRGYTRADAYGLVDFVDRWLTQHLGRIDVQLRDCVKP